MIARDGTRVGGRLDVWNAIYLIVVITGGAIVVVASMKQLASGPVPPSWFVLAALTIVAGSATLRFPNPPISFSISDSFTITAALLFGPAAGTVAVAIDSLVISLRLARRNLGIRRLLFNAAAPALAMSAAAHVFFLSVRFSPP